VTQLAIWSQRMVLTVAAAAAVLVLDAVTPLGLAVWLLQVVLVWVATTWAHRRQMIVIATVCAIFIVLAFVLSPKPGPITWVDQSNLLLGLGTVWALSHSCLRRLAIDNARREVARELGQMFRILSGVLPMCSWCKRIRNDAGTWEPLELYIRNQGGAGIMPGMCQECAVRFNPSIDDQQRG
jgi:hypothetical protein